ncbi:unnamed protein product [Caenorhabditis nigoni]
MFAIAPHRSIAVGRKPVDVDRVSRSTQLKEHTQWHQQDIELQQLCRLLKPPDHRRKNFQDPQQLSKRMQVPHRPQDRPGHPGLRPPLPVPTPEIHRLNKPLNNRLQTIHCILQSDLQSVKTL